MTKKKLILHQNNMPAVRRFTTGRNKEDYYTSYATWNTFDKNNKWTPLSATTGAGTYVVNNISSNMKGYTEPQIVRLRRADNNELSTSAIHAQTNSRVPLWNAGERRYSYGCISPAPQTMEKMSKLFNIGDTLYIDTEEPYNELREIDGKINAVFDKKYATPTKRHTWGETYDKK